MKILVLNGGPRKNASVATLLKTIAENAGNKEDIDWVDVYDLNIKHCLACMKCRMGNDYSCIQPEDDGHVVSEKIRECDALIVGSPVFCANISAALKNVFERTIPAFFRETSMEGFPTALHKGKPAAFVVSCDTPFPIDLLFSISTGGLRAMKAIPWMGGFKTAGQIVRTGMKEPRLNSSMIKKAEKLGKKIKVMIGAKSQKQ
ncbi:MAG: flavodoxin family protein [Chloroflexi bacterium]|nr:flavodoxin family protein [Chloroflexota bacterium]